MLSVKYESDMRGNSFGKSFKIHTFGESHGPGIGVVIDGCPAGLKINQEVIQDALDRRRPGSSELVSPRNESDRVEILSGVYNGYAIGTPITLYIKNTDIRKTDYDNLQNLYRPSHADFTWAMKFGTANQTGGGRASARETAARVAAGAVAAIVLQHIDVNINVWVSKIGTVEMDDKSNMQFEDQQIYSNELRCPDPQIAAKMLSLLIETKDKGDTVGGVISCNVTGCPPGLGEPVFDKIHADLGKAILSINACKGFEIGEGFNSANLFGSNYNDAFTYTNDKIQTTTNRAGGVLGGMTSGMPIYFRAAFKPVSSIKTEQETIDIENKKVTFSISGRHDPCVVPRAVPIVKAMTALVLCDHYLRNKNAIM